VFIEECFMKALSGKKYTARELAAQFGCSVDTVQNHANKLFGKARSGVARLFDEAQVTMLLESVKQVKQAGGRRTSETVSEVDLNKRLAKAETHLTPILRLKLIGEEKDRLHAEEIAIYRNEVKRLEELSARQAAWIDDTLAANGQLWRIAESAGALTSDREDMLSTYRR
jgi:hypothetical protein